MPSPALKPLNRAQQPDPRATGADPLARASTRATDSSDGVGEKLRRRRKIRNMSLSEVAGKAGLSIGLLSQIERELSTPSLRTLNQICEALEMPVRWLFDSHESAPEADQSVVVRRANRRCMDLGHAGMTKEILSSDAVLQLQLMRFVVRPGGESGSSPNQHATGAKAGTIVAGQLGLEIDGRQYLLRPGDSFSFAANATYRFWCAGEVDCELFWAVTPALY